jgi:hypothetical protein
MLEPELNTIYLSYLISLKEDTINTIYLSYLISLKEDKKAALDM